MPLDHERAYYEVAWRNETGGRHMPQLWWTQQYFRRWTDTFDGGLFDSKEAAFARNGSYRYWNMIGVKDAEQESLIGQAGEIEPVFDTYTLIFFLFDPATRACYFPQFPDQVPGGRALTQALDDDYLPVISTSYRTALGVDIVSKALATTIDPDQRSIVLSRLTATLSGAQAVDAWLCLGIVPAGPTGFQRSDRDGRITSDRRINFLQYLPNEQRVLVNSTWGPVFGTAPDLFGTYGNGTSLDPQFYVQQNPFEDLQSGGTLNGWNTATDQIAGLCSAVFAWQMQLSPAQPTFEIDVRLPVDDFRSAADLAAIRAPTADDLEQGNRDFWIPKLTGSGLQLTLPPLVAHLTNLFRTCRANLLILSDNGEIHPGPTIYDSFWIRDSAVEGIACALVGDDNLARVQFGTHYLGVFNRDGGNIGPARAYGFFGGDHEKNDLEWDANGEVLWAFGRFDRISPGFGPGVLSPYVIEAARWLRDCRSSYGLLLSGWSAEHLGGGKSNPHYWDDFWAVAGLWEAAKLAERAGAGALASEIWSIYDDLARSTADSIRWVLTAQRAFDWRTYIPTGPANVGGCDSTIIGTVAYFHPTRLYMGQKLGADIDQAARFTLDTIWATFVDGGFEHDDAWNAYGPYLTLQLAHAFLLLGDVGRMDSLLGWVVGAGFAGISPSVGTSADDWQIVLGAWNEQHCYPIATRFRKFPDWSWYMGDIPHGWACAEFMLLVRDILFFEADEDADPHIYLAPGVMPHWLADGESIEVSDAATLFGALFGYSLTLSRAQHTVTIDIAQPAPARPRFVYPCRFGTVTAITADGVAIPVTGNDVRLPAGTRHAVIAYQ